MTLFSLGIFVSSLDATNAWNFRIYDKRLVIARNINEDVSTVIVLDVLTNIPFTIETPNIAFLHTLILGKEFLANLKVYTSKNVEGVAADFTNFFKALDIDQEIEDFIRAYWIYPDKIRFELVEVEES
jgi:hypothetical protein